VTRGSRGLVPEMRLSKARMALEVRPSHEQTIVKSSSWSAGYELCERLSLSYVCEGSKYRADDRELYHRSYLAQRMLKEILHALQDVNEIALACTNIHSCARVVLQWPVQKYKDGGNDARSWLGLRLSKEVRAITLTRH
jgi:hypothetical protein